MFKGVKQLARVIANCPEKNLKECLDDIKHPVVGDLETLKDIMPSGTYGMSGTDYNKQTDYNGTLNVSHDDSSIQLDSKFKLLPWADGAKEIARTGLISADSTSRLFYSSTTKKPHGEQFAATKNLKCVSKDGNSVTWLGYGSSTSTEKYHCGTNIKKVFTKIGNDSFSIETHLDGKKAYHCDYKQRAGWIYVFFNLL